MSQRHILATIALLIVAVNLVNTQLPSDELQPQNQPNQRHPSLTRARRMYALCPPDFTKIGNDCYFLSKSKESWLDAHFECKDRNSKLAEPLKFADRRLRKYLNNKVRVADDRWIGGMYNWQQMKWQWGYNGGQMKYQSFGEGEQSRENLQYHCTTMDPKTDYMWAAKQCTDRHYFICQHRMSYVNEKNRQKVYSKWNETYPNQLANEVEVYVSTNGKSSLIRNVPKKNRLNQNKAVQPNNQPPKGGLVDDNNNNPPDYLPFSLYSKLSPLQQKPHEDIIHPVQSSHATNNPKHPSQKPRKRHSRPLKLTGEVNLGTDKFREKKRKQRPIVVAETVTNAGRHHHHPNDIPGVETTSTTVTEEAPVMETTTQTSIIVERTTMTEVKRRLEEKALRRERLKEKLKALTPEERQAFLLMKQQRADAKKKGLLAK